MTRIAFFAASVLIAVTGSAFAGSDHYGADNANQPTASFDRGFTTSIRSHEMTKPAVDADMAKASAAQSQGWPEIGQGIWGN